MTGPLRRVNPVVALLYILLGPADCCGGPLRDTRYDPRIRQARDQARRIARRARRAPVR